MAERSTKRQKELLSFVDGFIKGHGYGPSYREIMRALGYKSVSTVATHIDGLIAKGYLIKRDNSARSLEVLQSSVNEVHLPKAPAGAQEKWLVEEVRRRFSSYESQPRPELLDELFVLVGTLKIVGFEEAHTAMRAKLLSIISKNN